jgi:hypothetical protein
MLYQLGRIHGAHLARRPVPPDCLFQWLFRYLPARVATGLFSRNSAAFDLTHSVKPPPWLVEEVQSASEEYFQRYFEVYRSGLDAFPDYNLHLGKPQAAAASYRPAVRTREELGKRTGQSPSSVNSAL